MDGGTGILPEHSPLGASSAERWMNCSGSVALAQALRGSGLYEDDDPDYRRDGTQAHSLAAFCFENRITAGEAMGEAEFPALDIEMVSAVQVYLDYANNLPGRHYIETRVQRPEFHELFYGTLDFVAFSIHTNFVEFIDYKHGAGVAVEAEDNKQLRYYAFGEIGEDHELYPDDQPIKLTICQPRLDHPDGSVRSVMTTAGAIRAWAYNELRPAMDRVQDDRFLSIGDWCRFCPAKLVCPAMINLLDEFASTAVNEEMSDELLAKRFEQWEAVKMMGKALVAEAQKRVVTKGTYTGTALKSVRAKVNRVWKEAAEAAIVAKFGDSAYSERKLLSPKQAEDTLGDAGKEAVAEWAYKPQGGFTVALAKDKRAEAKPASPEERFAASLQHMREAAE